MHTPTTIPEHALASDLTKATDGHELFAVAEHLARQLCRDALRAGGACNWLGWSMEPVAERFEPVIRSFGLDLYSGTPGVALFLARVAALTGDRVIRQTALGAVAPLEASSARGEAAPWARLGFFSGRVGQAWALDHIGDWLGLDRLRERALQLAQETAQVAITRHELDVVTGAAGAIPALLALAERHADHDVRRTLRDHARGLGRQLLSFGAPDAEGRLRWDTMGIAGQPPLTGQSHGASGIATALLELWALERDEPERARWLSAAHDALSYERELFVPAERNWPDLRRPGPGQTLSSPSSPPPCGTVWCHGAPGIGLGRLRCLELLQQCGSEPVEAARVRAELEQALATTLELLEAPQRFGGSWCQCHGFAGNAELPLQVAERSSQPALLAAARRVALLGLERYYRRGEPWPCGVPFAGQTPGLMLGLSGIGWFYLRVADPTGTPPVLLVRGSAPVMAQ